MDYLLRQVEDEVLNKLKLVVIDVITSVGKAWHNHRPLELWRRIPTPVSLLLVGGFAAVMLLFVPLKLTPFIYFQF